MTAADLQSVALLATLCGLLGGMAAWALLVALAAGFGLLRDWYATREDRAFVLAQDACLRRRRTRGRAGLGALLVVVLLAVLAAACAPAPVAYDDDHGNFLERVKKSGF